MRRFSSVPIKSTTTAANSEATGSRTIGEFMALISP
jgi:hypothetical protein